MEMVNVLLLASPVLGLAALYLASHTTNQTGTEESEIRALLLDEVRKQDAAKKTESEE